MMKLLVILALAGCATAQANTNRWAGRYVWDLLKPALTIQEMTALLSAKEIAYPTYAAIPQTSFQCSSKAQPGFYADVDTQCQVYHRCELNGNRTDYICVNGSVFNQVTLICDYWFNVDCARSIELEDFANSRLYTNLPLFDSPPADYISPSQKAAGQTAAVQPSVKVLSVPAQQVKKPVPVALAKPKPGQIKASGRAESSGSSDDQGAAPVAAPDATAADQGAAAPVAAAGRAAAEGDHDSDKPSPASGDDKKTDSRRRKRRSLKL